MITLRLPKATEDRLRAMAEEQGVALAAFMRLVIAAGVAQLAAPTAPQPVPRRRVYSKGVD